MQEAVKTGLTTNMTSRLGMVNNSAKKVTFFHIYTLTEEFKTLISRTMGAKEVNSCMGWVVAAPTTGSSGILPGILTTLQDLHKLSDCKIHKVPLVVGIASIIEENASLAKAVGRC